jgi:hypothetical protein
MTIRIGQTKRLRFCSVCKNGIDKGEYVIEYNTSGMSHSFKSVCDYCARKLASEVYLKNQEWIEEIHK